MKKSIGYCMLQDFEQIAQMPLDLLQANGVLSWSNGEHQSLARIETNDDGDTVVYYEIWQPKTITLKPWVTSLSIN